MCSLLHGLTIFHLGWFAEWLKLGQCAIQSPPGRGPPCDIRVYGLVLESKWLWWSAGPCRLQLFYCLSSPWRARLSTAWQSVLALSGKWAAPDILSGKMETLAIFLPQPDALFPHLCSDASVFTSHFSLGNSSWQDMRISTGRSSGTLTNRVPAKLDEARYHSRVMEPWL